jgi:hypothetical protein
MNETFGADEDLEREVAALLRSEAAFGEDAGLGFSSTDIVSRRHRFATDQMRRRALLVSVAAVSIVAIVLPLSLAGGGHTGSPKRVSPLAHSPVDMAATPAGWAPVPFGSGQISVPDSWLVTVTTTGSSRCGLNPNLVLISGRPVAVVPKPIASCPLGQNDVFIAPMSHIAAPRYGTMLVNGIRVGIGSPGFGGDSYVVPALHEELFATGPLAKNYDFGGIRFSAPSGWGSKRLSWWGGCPSGLEANTVELSTALTFSAPSCGFLAAATAGSEAARYGVIVGAGPAAEANGINSHQCLSLDGLHACSAEFAGTAFGGENFDGVLTLSVNVPGQPKPVVVEIGLAGSGATALAIVDSIQKA